MKTLEYRFIDKSEWGAGPWQSEPDKLQWPDAETGLPCLIVRGPMGSLCGYVGVAPDHPLYGVAYGYEAGKAGALDLSAHGGLTFAGPCAEHEHGICHVAEPGEPDPVHWFGFDCAHGGDLVPQMEVTARKYYPELKREMDSRRAEIGYRFEDVYRTVDYVQRECAQLVAQLANYKGPRNDVVR